MPVWPCVQATAQQDHLACLLLQVHVDKLNGFKQLCIKDCSGGVIKQVILGIGGVRCIKHLQSSNLRSSSVICCNVPWQLSMHDPDRGSADNTACIPDVRRLCKAPMRRDPRTLGKYSCSAVLVCMPGCELV